MVRRGIGAVRCGEVGVETSASRRRLPRPKQNRLIFPDAHFRANSEALPLGGGHDDDTAGLDRDRPLRGIKQGIEGSTEGRGAGFAGHGLQGVTG